MAKTDQLEIIKASGQVAFYDLDPVLGITNIGQHQENDVVIDSPRVAPFQAVLDHRQKPFSLVVLSDEGEVYVSGERVGANAATHLHNFDTIQLDGVSVVLVEGEGGELTAGPAGASTAAIAGAGVAAAGTLGEAATAARMAPRKAARAPEPRYQPLGMPPPDQIDDVIVLELPERAFTIDVLQTAIWRLTLINAGPLVAELAVNVEGIEADWVQVLPPKVNLNEGQRTTVTISVSPPRAPTSLAGNHHFAIVVTSPDYPGHVAQLGATLTLNPYYDYSVGELSPRQRNVGYTRRIGEYAITISNKGNSSVPYEVRGEDDQHGCSFEFIVPGESVGLARQASVHVDPGQMLVLPVHVTPLQNRLIGLRKRSYSLTVTTTPGAGDQSQRSVLGQLQAAPLIGPWLILLVAAILAVLIAIIFRPWISTFTVDRQAIRAGETARLTWNASSFTGLRIEPDIGAVDGPSGSRVISPAVNTQYQLIAENLLTKISAVWFSDVKAVPVAVDPVLPVINSFGSDKTESTAGQNANIYWDVVGADDVQLIVNNAPETIQSADYISNRTMRLDQDTTFVLKAQNRYTTDPVQRSFTIRVNPATPTPVPTPEIVKFDVNPKVITAGQSVNITWEVMGVNEVQISNIPGSTTFPPQGSFEASPNETVIYVLSAGIGNAKITRQWQVQVNPAPPTPTPTPVPNAPVIEYFTITPNQVVKGNADANQVTLSWSVLTGTTNIQITSPDMAQPVDSLASQGNMIVAGTKTTLYILTAYNGDLKTSATAALTVLDPTPTGTPPPTGTPVPTPTPTPTTYPAPIIQSFTASKDAGDTTGEVTQVYSTSLTTGTTLFQVTYGTHIILNWTTTNAQTVVLEGFGSQPSSGSSVSAIEVTAPVQYHLQASNPSPLSPANAYVRIELKPKAAPPAPFGVSSSAETTSSVTINWNYDGNYQGEIVGFRIYRAPQGSSDFVKVIAEYALTPGGDTLSNASRTWTDTASPVCGQQYYVVGVYQDTFGNAQETAVGVPTILTSPCPTAGNWQLDGGNITGRSIRYKDARLPGMDPASDRVRTERNW
jgi:hypothetical protein